MDQRCDMWTYRYHLYALSMSQLLYGSGGGGALAKNLETTCDKKIGSNIFIVDKFCKKCTCNIGDFKIMQYVYM